MNTFISNLLLTSSDKEILPKRLQNVDIVVFLCFDFRIIEGLYYNTRISKEARFLTVCLQLVRNHVSLRFRTFSMLTMHAGYYWL